MSLWWTETLDLSTKRNSRCYMDSCADVRVYPSYLLLAFI